MQLTLNLIITLAVAAAAVATLGWSAVRDMLFERIVGRLFTWYMVIGIMFQGQQLRQEQRRLQTPSAYEPVGRALARLCQTLPDGFPEYYAGSEWLPTVIRELGPNGPHIIQVHTNGTTLSTGSGMAGFWGYRLMRDTNAVSAVSNLWHLSYFGPGRSEIEGFSTNFPSFWLAKDDRFDRSELIESALNAYDREVKQAAAVTIVMQGRINFVRELLPARLQEICEEGVRRSPDHWWPQLTLALLGSARGPRTGAVEVFTDYVRRQPSFSRYLWVAYLNQVLGRDADAADAVEQAIQQPVVDLPDDVWNTEDRGYTAGVYLLTTGHYATVVRLCDALLLVGENGDYAKPDLQALRVAAAEAAAGRPVSFQRSEDMGMWDPYEYTDLQALRAWMPP